MIKSCRNHLISFKAKNWEIRNEKKNSRMDLSNTWRRNFVRSLYIWTPQQAVQPNGTWSTLSFRKSSRDPQVWLSRPGYLVTRFLLHSSMFRIRRVRMNDFLFNAPRTRGDKDLRFSPFEARVSKVWEYARTGLVYLLPNQISAYCRDPWYYFFGQVFGENVSNDENTLRRSLPTRN